MGLEDLKNRRSEGWAAGAGLTYGCVWPIARRWNLECTVGLGYWYTDYDKFESRKCGLFQRLEEMGIEDGDTVDIYDIEFEYQR